MTTPQFIDALDAEELERLGNNLPPFRPPRLLLSPPYLDLLREEEILALSLEAQQRNATA